MPPEELLTVNPDQVPLAADVPADARVFFHTPGGPLQRIAFDRLLAKLVATDLAISTQALLVADLDHDADTVAMVYDDPAAVKNGWWRKTGASGAGAWIQFDTFALAAEELVEQAAANAAACSLVLNQILTIVVAGQSYLTKAALNAALAGQAANSFSLVWVDETHSGHATVYQKVSGVATFVRDLTVAAVAIADVTGLTGALAAKADANAGTLTNPTVTNYTETVKSPASGTAFTISLADGTAHYYQTSGNATFTLPTPAAGKSFTVTVRYGGAHTVSWAGGARKWPGNIVPTPTSVNGKEDVFVFSCVDGSNWLAALSMKNL